MDNGASIPKRQSAMGDMNDRLHGKLQQLREQNTRIESIAQRISGYIPPPLDKADTVETPKHHLATSERIMADMQRELERMDSCLSHLSEII